MTEQIITIETAKLAKEKGFSNCPDEDLSDYCIYCKYYDGYKNNVPEEKWEEYYPLSIRYLNIDQGSSKYDYSPQNSYEAPTQSLLQKWLREKHQIHVEPYISNKLYGYRISMPDNNPAYSSIQEYTDVLFASSYEQALEEGLFKGLKLVNI